MRTLAIAAGAALLAMAADPALAGGTFTTDGNGVDYDAACIVGLGSTVANAGNNCNGITLYDGSTLATDIGNNGLGMLVNCPPLGMVPADLCLGSVYGTPSGVPQMFGGIRVRATAVPAPGNTTPPNGVTFDLPSNGFVGANYFNLFQNKSVHTNMPTNPVGGCPRVGTGTPVFDQYGAWQDGYHFFTNYSIGWDGSKWIHVAQVGEYQPGPDGGFLFHELGHNDGGGWVNADPFTIKGINWDAAVTSTPDGTFFAVWVDGVFNRADTTNCSTGFFKNAYAKPGDVIANAKGLTTANLVLTLPVAIPVSLLCGVTGGAICDSDIKTVGGFVVASDTTDGNSTPGLLAQNIPNIAYTRGLIDNHTGLIDLPDTLGDGPTCPTPTFGGLLPTNPLFVPGAACQIDDDPIARGTILSEMWDTTHGFVF